MLCCISKAHGGMYRPPNHCCPYGYRQRTVARTPVTMHLQVNCNLEILPGYFILHIIREKIHKSLRWANNPQDLCYLLMGSIFRLWYERHVKFRSNLKDNGTKCSVFAIIMYLGYFKAWKSKMINSNKRTISEWLSRKEKYWFIFPSQIKFIRH